jgi:hypothetical protein
MSVAAKARSAAGNAARWGSNKDSYKDSSKDSTEDPPSPSPSPSQVKKTTTRFGEFWAVWPSSIRKVAKAACEKKWAQRGLDAHADQIIAHVRSMKGTKQWVDGFDPAPMTYINQSRWEDGAPAGGSSTGLGRML